MSETFLLVHPLPHNNSVLDLYSCGRAAQESYLVFVRELLERLLLRLREEHRREYPGHHEECEDLHPEQISGV